MQSRHLIHALVSTLILATGCNTITSDMLDGVNSDAAYKKTYVSKYSQPPALVDTPFTEVLQCLGSDAETGVSGANYLNKFRYSISVGKIADLTGKMNINSSIGSPVSNGAQNMLTSAIMLSNGFRLINRTDTAISDLERHLTSKKLIKEYDQNDAQRLRSLSAGEVTGSDYYIYGSVTSFDYNIASGGSEAIVAGIGLRGRYFVASATIDLFLVNTRSTEILKSVSLHKQLVGREVKANLFSFDWLDNEFLDLSSGIKESEAAGIALRAMLEKSAIEFTGFLYDWSNVPDRCKFLYASANLKRVIEE